VGRLGQRRVAPVRGLVVAERTWDTDGAVHAAILFAVLYTIDSLARGLAWAESKREPGRGRA